MEETEDINETIDTSEVIDGLNISYLKYSGLWDMLNTYRSKRVRNRPLNIALIGTILSITPYFILQCISVFYVNVDIEKMALFVLNPLTCLQTLLKMIVFWVRLEDQCKLQNLLKKNYLSCTPQNNIPKGEEILRKSAIQSNYLAVVALFVNFGCVIVWNFLPVIRSHAFAEYFNVATTVPAKSSFPNKLLAGWYPFNYIESPGYEIVYVYEFAICTLAGVVVSIHELLVAQTVMMLYGQISVLALNLETLQYPSQLIITDKVVSKEEMKRITVEYPNNPTPISNGSPKEVEEAMYNQLLLCVKDHQKLMRAADNAKDLYNFVITMQLLTGGLIMIFSAFHFVFGVQDMLFFIKFAVYLGYAVVEIILYCYSGCLLETVSEEVTQAAYRTEWYNAPKRFRNTLQLLMVRNTKPQTLLAGKLYPVNLMTLSNLLQLTYSTSALLSRMNDESHQ